MNKGGRYPQRRMNGEETLRFIIENKRSKEGYLMNLENERLCVEIADMGAEGNAHL